MTISGKKKKRRQRRILNLRNKKKAEQALEGKQAKKGGQSCVIGTTKTEWEQVPRRQRKSSSQQSQKRRNAESMLARPQKKSNATGTFWETTFRGEPERRDQTQRTYRWTC